MDINTMITTYNTAVTNAANGILGKECRRKKAVGHLYDGRTDLKKKRYEAEANIQGSKQDNSEGSEESTGGLDRCLVRGD